MTSISPNICLRTGAASITCALLLCAQGVHASDGTFISVASGSNWSDTTRWQDGIVAGGAGATADFSQAGTTSTSFRVVRLDADVTLGSLILGDVTGVQRARWQVTTLTGNSLTFSHPSGDAVLVAGPGSTGGGNELAAALEVRLASSLEVRADTEAAFLLAAPVTAVTAGPLLISNRGTGTGAVTLGGSITDGAGVVAVLQDSPASTLFLGGANDYSGGTTIRAGVVSINDPSRLGAPAGPVVFEGGTMIMTGATSNKEFHRATTLAAGGGTFQTSSGAIPLWAGEVSGSGTLTKTGVGAFVLGAANSYAGGTIVNLGTLWVENSTGSATGTGGVTVNAGLLAGGGTIAPVGQPILLAGTGELAVGGRGDAEVAGIRTLTLRSGGGEVNFTQQAGTTLHLDLADPDNHERLVFDGVAGVALAGNLSLNWIGSHEFTAGDALQLFAWGDAVVTGGFANDFVEDLPTLAEGLEWDVADLYSSGVIQVVDATAPGGYAAWDALAALPEEQRGPLASPAGDGISNLLKFALGLDPQVRAGSVAAVGSEDVGGTDYPMLVFVRRADLGDVTLVVEIASDAAFNQMLDGVLVSEIDRGDGTLEVRVRSTVATATLPSQFLRLRATLTP